MSALRTFIRLTPKDQKLVLRAIIVLAVCWVRLRIQAIEKIRAWAARPGNGAIPAQQLTWAVKTASRRVPRVTCLSQALALQHLLSGNGHCSELRIGVDNSDGQFTAHAWLILNDRVLIGGSALENYKLLAAWSARGGLVGSGPEGPKLT